jgi:hypothetical protein
MADLLPLLRSADIETISSLHDNRRKPIPRPAGLSDEDQGVFQQVVLGEHPEALLLGDRQVTHVKSLTSGRAVYRTVRFSPAEEGAPQRAQCSPVEEPVPPESLPAAPAARLLPLSSAVVAVGVFLLGLIAGVSLTLQALDVTLVSKTALVP